MDVGPEERLVIEPSMDVVLKFYQVFFFKDYQYFLSFYWIWMAEMANHIC